MKKAITIDLLPADWALLEETNFWVEKNVEEYLQGMCWEIRKAMCEAYRKGKVSELCKEL